MGFVKVNVGPRLSAKWRRTGGIHLVGRFPRAMHVLYKRTAMTGFRGYSARVHDFSRERYNPKVSSFVIISCSSTITLSYSTTSKHSLPFAQ